MSAPTATLSALAAVTLFMIVSLVTVGVHNNTAPHNQLATTQAAHIDG